MLVLGLSGGFSPIERELIPGFPAWVFHDSAAALLHDGNVVAAVEEERLARLKHTNKFCGRGVRYCLEAAELKLSDVDRIAFFFGEEYTDVMLGLQYLEHPALVPHGARALLAAALEHELDQPVDQDKIAFIPHHLAHAASTYFQSGFDDALTVIMDGRGGDESLSIFDAAANQLTLLNSLPPRVSLGCFYAFAIELLGYRTFDEYKVMGLAPHGDAAVLRSQFRQLYELLPEGGYELDSDRDRLRSHFLRQGFTPRHSGEPFTQAHKDFAAALQETLETFVVHVLSHWRRQSGRRRLCFAGGVAHNCSLNGKTLRSGLFESAFVHPAAHDAGAAVGAALQVTAREAPERFRPRLLRHMYRGPSLGPEAEIAATLARWSAFVETSEPEDVCETVAEMIHAGAVVGWVQGRSEFGPRALGTRSILADPRPAENRTRINDLVKKREAYRPFAPAVLQERVDEYFIVPAASVPLDFMNVVVEVCPEKRALLGAVTHVDGTARVQTVRRETNPRFWRLIERFGALSGVPVLLNTSFNNNSEPIVQTVHDAVTCLLTTELDAVAIDRFVVRPRRAAWSAYLELAPSVHLAARIRSEFAPTAAGGRSETHQLYFAHTWGTVTDVLPAVAATLAHADGKTSLAELGRQACVDLANEESVAEIVRLWSRRFITLNATQPAGHCGTADDSEAVTSGSRVAARAGI